MVRRLRDDDVLRSLLLDVVQEYWFEPLLTRTACEKLAEKLEALEAKKKKSSITRNCSLRQNEAASTNLAS